ncbi:hypothetical protein LMG22037_00965 [Paraburkholderia phenoliruptrix]|uniref:Uncharacterized protein n=2 Tax=Paraburkholderia phenoliruptrix TaxID=252970 RepID=A0A6J5A2N1_9BURK|nr:hypothetical protein LMG22037_00965 [Paraburkholderia phenoliruptrix]
MGAACGNAASCHAVSSGTLRPLQQLAFDSMETPFNDRGVSVTRNALSSAGQVFPLRDIVGVHVVTIQKNKVLPITISVVGLVGAIVGGLLGVPAGLVCGVMLVVVGWLTWATQDITHRLMVQTADGEREALSSVDRDFVERVGAAVNEAKGAAAAASAAQKV